MRLATLRRPVVRRGSSRRDVAAGVEGTIGVALSDAVGDGDGAGSADALSGAAGAPGIAGVGEALGLKTVGIGKASDGVGRG